MRDAFAETGTRMGVDTVNYAAFLAIFLGVPLAVLLALSRQFFSRRLLVLLGVLAVVAVVYTGPWDSAIIAQGVWSYGAGQVVGLVINRVPLEEYVFYLLQVVLTGTFTAWLVTRARH